MKTKAAQACWPEALSGANAQSLRKKKVKVEKERKEIKEI